MGIASLVGLGSQKDWLHGVPRRRQVTRRSGRFMLCGTMALPRAILDVRARQFIIHVGQTAQTDDAAVLGQSRLGVINVETRRRAPGGRGAGITQGAPVGATSAAVGHRSAPESKAAAKRGAETTAGLGLKQVAVAEFVVGRYGNQAGAHGWSTPDISGLSWRVRGALARAGRKAVAVHGQLLRDEEEAEDATPLVAPGPWKGIGRGKLRQ